MVAGLRITFADDPVHHYHAAHVLPLWMGVLPQRGGKKSLSEVCSALFPLVRSNLTLISPNIIK